MMMTRVENSLPSFYSTEELWHFLLLSSDHNIYEISMHCSRHEYSSMSYSENSETQRDVLWNRNPQNNHLCSDGVDLTRSDDGQQRKNPDPDVRASFGTISSIKGSC